jgi:hypothetical protein
MGESDFLNVLEHLSVVGRSVEQDLEGCLSGGTDAAIRIRSNSVKTWSPRTWRLLNVFAKFSG